MENAILMAAGLGTRMNPLTLHTPKPLIEVNNISMIETIIKALMLRKISNIYIAVGYMSEKFEHLKAKYPNIELIFNPDFEVSNNISSLYYSLKKLKNGDLFICETDLFIRDSSIFLHNLNNSCYFAKFINGYSNDWIFEVENNYIKKITKGGSNRYNMVGISYFKEKDAEILSQIIKNEYEINSSKNMFWDEIVNNNLDKLKLTIHSVSQEQIYEIDTVAELEILNEKVKHGS